MYQTLKQFFESLYVHFIENAQAQARQHQLNAPIINLQVPFLMSQPTLNAEDETKQGWLLVGQDGKMDWCHTGSRESGPRCAGGGRSSPHQQMEASNPCCPLCWAKRQVCPCAYGGSTRGRWSLLQKWRRMRDLMMVQLRLIWMINMDSRAAVESSPHKLPKIQIYLLRS